MKNTDDMSTPLAEQGTASLPLVLASVGELPLPSRRVAAAAAILAAWLPDANELSRKMAAPIHQHLLPATVFTHPGFDEEATP